MKHSLKKWSSQPKNFKLKVSVRCNVSNNHDPPGSLI